MRPFALLRKSRPRQSLVVVMHNMRREAARTLYSLSSKYQKGVDAEEYEVIVVDNGSVAPLDETWVTNFGPQFRYFYHEPKHPSPVEAVNLGARRARGSQLGIFIDGARIATPNLLRYARAAAAAFPQPVVATLNWHIGPKLQHLAMQEGYDQETEDRMIAECGWPEKPYALHSISVLGGSSSSGYFLPLSESNAIFVSRPLFNSLGGYDERFLSPGGGLVNLDFYRRACESPDVQLVVLLGEGTFHQIHGGVMTNAAAEEKSLRWRRFEQEYVVIRGRPFRPPDKQPVFLGGMPPQALGSLAFSAKHALKKSAVGQ